MGDLVGLATGSSLTTMVLTVVVKLFAMYAENAKNRSTLTSNITDMNIKAMDAAASRGGEAWYHYVFSALGRFMMLTVALAMLVYLTVHSAQMGDAVMFVPEQDPYSLRFLGITLFELDLGTTWTEFKGTVVFPIWFMIIGAAGGYFFGAAPFDRR